MKNTIRVNIFFVKIVGEQSIRRRLVIEFETQCSVFKRWTLVSKWQKNVFGHTV